MDGIGDWWYGRAAVMWEVVVLVVLSVMWGRTRQACRCRCGPWGSFSLRTLLIGSVCQSALNISLKCAYSDQTELEFQSEPRGIIVQPPCAFKIRSDFFNKSRQINSKKIVGSIVKCYNRHDGAKLWLFFSKRITKLEGKIFSVVGNFFSTSSLVTQIKELMVSEQT